MASTETKTVEDMSGQTTMDARAADHRQVAATTFQSVLYRPDDAGDRELSPPAFFTDLNLDQLVAQITAACEGYDLAEFFYAPLHDADAVAYRHEVVRDLQSDEICAAVKRFVTAMHEMRRQLELAGNLHTPLQRQRWFLAAVETYCRAVETFDGELNDVRPRSTALRGLVVHLASVARSDAFKRLGSEMAPLLQDLAGVTYTVMLKGLQVTVDHFAGEDDLTEQIQSTFERFREDPAETHRWRFRDSADANQVEARILALVAELNPELFERLRSFCERHHDYVDATLSRFEREVHFYLGYLDYVTPLADAGVALCLPTVSAESKEVRAREGLDLVLARKLVGDGSEPVVNDFDLHGAERILVITGPNQGGKTTFSRMFGQLHHLAALGLPVAAREATLYLPDRVFCHFEREEQLSTLRSKFEHDLVRIHQILDVATDRSILIMNESFSSTSAQDALRVGRQVLGRVIERDMICVCVTFVDELSTLGETTVSMMSTVDADDPTRRTYKVVRKPADGLAYAVALAQLHGLGYEQLTRRFTR
jgi:DNA mismatch repair protein MutS